MEVVFEEVRQELELLEADEAHEVRADFPAEGGGRVRRALVGIRFRFRGCPPPFSLHLSMSMCVDGASLSSVFYGTGKYRERGNF